MMNIIKLPDIRFDDDMGLTSRIVAVQPICYLF